MHRGETLAIHPTALSLVAVRRLPRLRDWPDAAQRRWTTLSRWPPVGGVRFGSLRRVTPISDTFGFDRGLPIDRYYIERFLGEHSACIRGRVLEVGESLYAKKFGQDVAVERIDILDVRPDNPRATLVADLTEPEAFPTDAFDCVICTQTLPYIYDIHAAVRTLHRILRPRGVVLATVTSVSRIWTKGDRLYGDYWRFTSRSSRLLFEEAFAADDVTVASYGNVLAATSFLYGLATVELSGEELDFHDPDFPVVIGIKARRRAEGTD
jgi:SAM-dependent methyltransferase